MKKTIIGGSLFIGGVIMFSAGTAVSYNAFLNCTGLLFGCIGLGILVFEFISKNDDA
jgi:hypothetical protein